MKLMPVAFILLLLIICAVPNAFATDQAAPQLNTTDAPLATTRPSSLPVESTTAIPIEEKIAADDRPLLSQQHSDTITDPAKLAEAETIVRDFEQSEEQGKAFLHLLAEGDAEKFLVQFDKGCNLSEIPEQAIRRDIETENYRFMVVVIPEALLTKLVKNECALKVADVEHEEAFFAYAERVLEEERKALALALNVEASSTGLTDYGTIVDDLEDSWDKAEGRYSPLQQYVTPDDARITVLAEGKTPEQLYTEALSWPWVSDPTLWQQDENWVTPDALLAKTPGVPDNPFPGRPISDCEEHANGLVSLLRAEGVSPKDVRVAIGLIDFDDGTSGGHAWVEYRLDDTWIVLDSTVGDYYDDAENKTIDREGFSFTFWNYHTFPIKDVWAYYNDKYFLDLREGHAPGSWEEGAGTLFEKQLRDGMEWTLWERIVLFFLKTVGKVV